MPRLTLCLAAAVVLLLAPGAAAEDPPAVLIPPVCVDVDDPKVGEGCSFDPRCLVDPHACGVPSEEELKDLLEPQVTLVCAPLAECVL